MKNFTSFIQMKNWNNRNTFSDKIEKERIIQDKVMRDVLMLTKRKPTENEKIR